MKYILTCCIAVIVTMLYERPANDDLKNSATFSLTRVGADIDAPSNFRENKILVAEFLHIIKNNTTGIASTSTEMTRREELKQKIMVN